MATCCWKNEGTNGAPAGFSGNVTGMSGTSTSYTGKATTLAIGTGTPGHGGVITPGGVVSSGPAYSV